MHDRIPDRILGGVTCNSMRQDAQMRANVPAFEVLGVPVTMFTVEAALAEVRTLLTEPGPALLAYVNAHALNLAQRNAAYHDVLRRADLVLNDGSGLAIAARIRGARFPANLNGTDFTPLLLTEAARLGAPVFLLGGRPGVAELAARRLAERIDGLNVAGFEHGYHPAEEQPALAERIHASGAQVLVVGMGNPAQELWLDRHLPATGTRLGVAVGAFLDFASGQVPRAPQWMRTAGIEWLYRLKLEPRRLFRRYVIGNPEFLFRVMRERFNSSRPRGRRTGRGRQ